MTPTTKYAHERLWKLNDHADLQMYGPDLLIQDVQTVVAALASAERDLSQLRAELATMREDRAIALALVGMQNEVLSAIKDD